MRVAVVVPWRGGQPDRERHHVYVRDHLRKLRPEAAHFYVDTHHEPFSRAAARNHGVRLAAERGADVVVLCDADTLPEAEPLHSAIAEAFPNPVLHLPYTRFRGLSRTGTKRHIAGLPADECEAELVTNWSTGGIMVCIPSAWFEAGGMDEGFTGWGFEDAAFRIAADAILGPTVKHEGTIAHLWHPSAIAPSTQEYRDGAALAARYVEAEGNPDAVRALIAERQATSV